MTHPPTRRRRGALWLVLLTALIACSPSDRTTLTPSPERALRPKLAPLAQAPGANGAPNSAPLKAHQRIQPKPPPTRPLPQQQELLEAANGTLLQIYPPLATAAVVGAAAPIAVMLHGMCGSPEGACSRWQDTPQQHGWLMCPSGNVRCGGHFDWQGDGETKAQHIDASMAALRAHYPDQVAAPGGDVLMGFSRGAFVARDVAYARPGRFVGLVLIGAALKPDADKLRRSGIRRVVLASGELDGARPTMQLAAGLLNRAGIPARFISLGRVWHTLPDDLHKRLKEPLAWVAAKPAAPLSAQSSLALEP